MPKTETPIVAAIIDALAAAGIWCWRTNSGRVQVRGGWFYGAPAGTPDVLGVLEGRLFGVEVKTRTGKLQESQKAWHAMAARHGVMHGVARNPREALALVREWRGLAARG